MCDHFRGYFVIHGYCQHSFLLLQRTIPICQPIQSWYEHVQILYRIFSLK